MKLTLSVLMIAAGIVRASGDAVSCSVIDYLYYSSDCCDGSNSVQCMESIPQTDKAAIDNLASLKRPEGAACESGDSIKFLNSKIVCTTADSCLIPCVNGNITGSVSGNITGSVSTTCACACNAGFSGADCSTADPTTTTLAPAATTTTTLAPAPTHKLDDGSANYADAAAFVAANTLIADSAACLALADDIRASVRLIPGQESYEYKFIELNQPLVIQPIALSSTFPKGCSVRLSVNQNDRHLYWNTHATGAKPSANNIAVVAP